MRNRLNGALPMITDDVQHHPAPCTTPKAEIYPPPRICPHHDPRKGEENRGTPSLLPVLEVPEQIALAYAAGACQAAGHLSQEGHQQNRDQGGPGQVSQVRPLDQEGHNQKWNGQGHGQEETG